MLERFTGLYRPESGKLVLCAVCASLLTASTIYGYQFGVQRSRSSTAHHQALESANRPHESIQLNAAGGPVKRDSPAPMSEELIREQLSRNYLFFGPESMDKIRSSFVIVVGVGGVGSWTATMLVRSGVQKIRIIDFDQVTLSSLNRHACATLADVGTSKVLTLQRYLEKVAPWVQIECRNDLFQKEDADTLLEPWVGTGQRADFVIDAIDNIETKADLLAYCVHHDLAVVASMGAALKSDPTRIYLSDISETFEDPLSRATRRHLKLRGIQSGIPVIYSTEKPGPGKARLEPIDQSAYEAGEISELGILPDFRARILPVLGTMPPIFGLSLVTFVLTTMAGYPTPSTKVSKTRRSLYESAFKDLTRECGEARIPLTVDDVGFLIDELANGRSVLPPHYPQKLTLIRYDPVRRVEIGNIVVLTKDEAKKHASALKDGQTLDDIYSLEEKKSLEKYFARSVELRKWRDGF